MSAKTLFDKIWDAHCVLAPENAPALLYIDRHLIHEVTSPQAFEGLRLQQRKIWRVGSNLAVPDHNVPTTSDRLTHIHDPLSAKQLAVLEANCEENKVPFISLADKRQGIVHVIGPEQGAILPGMTVVCGDSHTSTHGAFGAIAMGIGTSEVEHVMATQCLRQSKPKTLKVSFEGMPPEGITAKDMALALIGEIGTAGGTGYAIEYTGKAVEALSMAGRMTLCNLSIEAGARCGLVAVDETTLAYLKDKPMAPKGEAWEQAALQWQQLKSDRQATFDREVSLDVSSLSPQVTWGTSPEMVVGVDAVVPSPKDSSSKQQAQQIQGALDYMGLRARQAITEIALDRVFIGSCTNSRLEDLEAAAAYVKGRKVAASIKEALVVPGSGLVKAAAEQLGLDKIFTEAGFQWREPGCSMCLAMNPDRLKAGEHCASTSNRNFEGRQGQGGRTHLVSPIMAAAAAIHGHFVDVREVA